ncbi:MAG TPA: peptidyl-prolyl cis-trans isomerase [Solirubrobacteraceae bacterium]|nr:peptidyl-prolyl cis-trans isomerase [Solirubrobacteraceae bacterium]
MSKAFRFIPALGAVLFALVGISACGGIPGDAVVQVNGKSITKSAFNHWMGVAAVSSGTAPGAKAVIPEPPNYTACIAHLAATQPKPAKGQPAPTTAKLKSECETQYKALQQEVLGFLISSEWVLGEASSLGVKLTDAEVKKQFTKIKNQQFPKAAEFEKFLSSSGQTVSDLLLRVKLNLLSTKIQQKIVKSKGAVTQAQIAKYYNENKSRFGTPEKRTVQIILTKTEAAAKSAKKEVESGKSFATVAKRVSIDPTSKANGGLLKEVAKGQEEKSLDAAIFSTKAGVLSGPIKTPFGYYIFEVKSTTPSKQSSLAQVQSSIKQQLAAQNQQQALSKFVKDFKTKWTSKTDCRSGFVVTDCKQYKAPKTGSTSKTPTP